MMHISIWQQFSSNHSSYFTVIGQFASAIGAQRAASDLRLLIQSIADYYAAHPEAAEVWNDEGLAPPTPPEIQMARQYQVSIDPEFGIDWIWAGMRMENAVVYWDKLVFVTHPGDTWHGAHPFDHIVEKLGGTAMVDGDQDAGTDHKEPSSSTWVRKLTCIAPDEQVAQSIQDEITASLRASREAWQSAGKIEIPDAPSQPNDRRWFMRDASTGGGKVEQQGQRLTFSDWRFRKLAYGLPAFAAYLTERRCTNIEYELTASIDEDD